MSDYYMYIFLTHKGMALDQHYSFSGQIPLKHRVDRVTQTGEFNNRVPPNIEYMHYALHPYS